jgi:hypothetical protein
MIRPVASLIVPVWGGDDLVADMVNRVSVDTATTEWVVAAVEPTEELRTLAHRGKIRLAVCDTPSRRGAAERRGRKSIWLSCAFTTQIPSCVMSISKPWRRLPGRMQSSAEPSTGDSIVGSLG